MNPKNLPLSNFLTLITSLPSFQKTDQPLILEVELKRPAVALPCHFRIAIQDIHAEEFLHTLHRLINPKPDPKASLPEQAWFQEFQVYLTAHLSNSKLSVSKMAYDFSMSESTLLRRVRRLTGLSPQKYLQEQRLKRAKMLLDGGGLSSVAQIALAVGYVTPCAFSRKFKREFGYSPSDHLQVA